MEICLQESSFIKSNSLAAKFTVKQPQGNGQALHLPFSSYLVTF